MSFESFRSSDSNATVPACLHPHCSPPDATRFATHRLGLGLFLLLSVTTIKVAAAGTVADNNLAANPPLYRSSDTTCTATFQLKPAGIQDHHGYVVVTGPDGKILELRGGPSRGGSGGTSVPGLDTSSSGDQPSGNPFNCVTSHQWGVVVPYVGRHGKLGTDASGGSVFSPDGNVQNPSYTVGIGPGAQKNVCAVANCMMSIIKVFGASCKIYTVGTGQLRNSNTLISLALSSCGVPDPLPAPMSATGWGNTWD
jgi:hypothetical protein